MGCRKNRSDRRKDNPPPANMRPAVGLLRSITLPPPGSCSSSCSLSKDSLMAVDAFHGPPVSNHAQRRRRHSEAARSGFAARCEAGLGPAGNATGNLLGLCPRLGLWPLLIWATPQ